MNYLISAENYKKISKKLQKNVVQYVDEFLFNQKEIPDFLKDKVSWLPYLFKLQDVQEMISKSLGFRNLHDFQIFLNKQEAKKHQETKINIGFDDLEYFEAEQFVEFFNTLFILCDPNSNQYKSLSSETRLVLQFYFETHLHYSLKLSDILAHFTHYTTLENLQNVAKNRCLSNMASFSIRGLLAALKTDDIIKLFMEETQKVELFFNQDNLKVNLIKNSDYQTTLLWLKKHGIAFKNFYTEDEWNKINTVNKEMLSLIDLVLLNYHFKIDRTDLLKTIYFHLTKGYFDAAYQEDLIRS